MPTEFKYQKEEDGNIVTLRLSGSLDVFNYMALKTLMDDITQNGKIIRLMVDMDDLDFVASSGWAVLMAQSKIIKRLGGKLVVYSMQESVQRVYSAMRADGFIISAQDRESALAAINAPD